MYSPNKCILKNMVKAIIHSKNAQLPKKNSITTQNKIKVDSRVTRALRSKLDQLN